MPYYSFKKSLSTEKIGKHFPQSSEMSKGYPYNEWNPVWKIRNEELFFTPNLDSFVLNGQSKKTDVISAVAFNSRNNILIKSSLAKIWKDFNTCEYQEFPATVIYRKQKLDYSLLHFYTYHNQFIDFKESNFYYAQIREERIRDLEINSINEFISTRSSIYRETQLMFTDNVCPYNLAIDKEKADLDFFLIEDIPGFNFIISEKFKEALLKEKATGIDLINLSEYRFEPRDRK